MLAPFGLALAAWLLLGAILDLLIRARYTTGSVSEILRRLRNLPRSDWGKAVAHAGLGLLVFGIAAITAWEKEDIRTAAIGDRYTLGAYEFVFQGVEDVTGPN